jgi:hypothetical protein
MKPLSSILNLRERGVHRVRLHRDEVEWLLQHARGVLRIEWTPQRGMYCLHVGGYVGCLVTPRRPIYLQAKLPAENLAWMLGVQLGPDGALASSDPTVAAVEPFVRLFAQRLEAVGQRGLYAEYQQTPLQGGVLQGPLDVAAQMRETRPDRLHSRPDDRTVDVPCNRLPVALACRLLTLPLSAETQGLLQRALSWWGGVSRSWHLPEWPEQIPPGYEALYEACGWLWASHNSATPSVLISLARVFERQVADCLGGIAQWCFSPCPPLTLRPDVTLLRGDKPFAVVDAKWKRWPLEVSDLYQVATYAIALRLKEAFLIYPGRRRPESLQLGRIRVRRLGLEVTGPLPRCQRSARRLQRLVQKR